MLDGYETVELVGDGGAHVSARVASNAWTRMKGLLGQGEVPVGEGLLIVPCPAIHCLGMSVPITVSYLSGDPRDGRARVLGTEVVRPWRLGHSPRGTRCVLETAESTHGALSASAHLRTA